MWFEHSVRLQRLEHRKTQEEKNGGEGRKITEQADQVAQKIKVTDMIRNVKDCIPVASIAW